MEYTNTYTQIKNSILTRKKYKILSFSDKEMELFYFNMGSNKIKLQEALSEIELDNLVSILNEQEIICNCEDTSNIEENC